MNVDRRWLGVSGIRLGVLGAGAGLLIAAYFVVAAASPMALPGSQNSSGIPVQEQPVASLASLLTPDSSVASEADSIKHARSILPTLPLVFEPNQGQEDLDAADSRVKFMARGAGYGLFLGSEGAIVSLVSHQESSVGSAPSSAPKVDSFQMKLAGANPNVALIGAEPLPGRTNYFLGNDPGKWRAGVPQFSQVRYENLYPGIDLVFYGNQGHLEYDFQVAPGSDPARAEFDVQGAKGLELSDGDLLIKGAGGVARLAAPRAYQEIDGRQQPVNAKFVIHGHRAGFSLGDYDHSRELVIDPVLTFSTYFGGLGDEQFTSIALDGAGNIYLAGSTTSTNLPTLGGLTTNKLTGIQNIYIAKIQPPLLSVSAALQYMTYLGGNGIDQPVGVAVDGAGDAFVAGTTTSTNFPTNGNPYQAAPQANSAGTQHVFVTELNSAATQLTYSSYLSGNGNDIASGMTIDSAGNIYVTGTTTSVETSTTDQFPASNLPNTLPYQTSSRLPGQLQFFVTKVSTQAPFNSSVPYSTYFGGANFAAPLVAVGGGIAVDSNGNGNIYFAGSTNFTYTGCAGCSNTDFPILNAYQPCLNQAPPSVPQNPPMCPTSSAANPDAFLAKLNPNAVQGQQLQWSTYLGGTGNDFGTGVAIDPGAANVYLTGTTNSTTFTIPTTAGSFQPTAGGNNDAFVARFPNLTPTLAATNLSLGYFSYLGGSGNEAGLAIAADTSNGALVTGWTQSPDFPIAPSPSLGCLIQCTLTGTRDAFAARINTVVPTGTNNRTASWSTYFGGTNTNEGTGIALDANQDTFFAGDTNSTDLRVAQALAANQGGSYNGGLDSFVTELQSAATVSIAGVPTLGTNQVYFWAGNPATFTYTITNTGTDLASGLTLTDDLSRSPVSLTNASGSVSGGACSGASTSSTLTCPLGSLQAGSTSTVTISVTPTANSSGTAENFNGGTVQVLGQRNVVLATTFVPASMSDFTMVVNPPDKSVAQAGQSAQYSVQITPHPVYGTNLTLACSGQPAGTACVFSPSSVTLQGTSAATVTLTISTTARPITTGSARSIFGHFYAVWLLVPGLALIGIGRRGNRRRRILGFLLLLLLFTQLVPLPACGGSNTQTPAAGTPSGTWPITVTAASGSDSKSQGIHLIVP